MSIHPSLIISEKDKMVRSVLKRTERIRQMHEKGKWKEGDSVYGLPKIKTLRIKIKKEKAVKEETSATVAGAPASAAPGAKDVSKAAPKAQPKAQEKK
jgi:small basic protein (TIGR04137 family)